MKFSHALIPIVGGLVLLAAFARPMPAFAQDNEPETKTAELMEPEASPTTPEEPAAPDPPASLLEVNFTLNNIVLFLSAVLVLFMQAGFAMVETGFNASKNAVNILFKNLMDMCLGVLLFWLVGYGLMYPGADYEGKYFGFGGIGIPETVATATPEEVEKATSDLEAKSPDDLTDEEKAMTPEERAEAIQAEKQANADSAATIKAIEDKSGYLLHPQVDFLFQVAFAATAATIVSGAVAGRLQFNAYLIYSIFITALVYPVSGMWKWGGGWLNEMGFWDFAGSLVVHACGGFAALAGAIVLGPRIGRFSEDGKSQPMPGHNLTVATLGVFILWIGWYGFNPGSQLTFTGAANASATMLIATNTTLAAAAGGVTAMILSWVMFSKPDLSMALNGVLAGLVGITANCDCVTNPESMIIGAIAGIVVVFGILALDKLKIDDPVGAFPVHGLCGVWGGIATGIFGTGHDVKTQLIGCVAIAAWAFLTMFILFSILKVMGILRVGPEEEVKGLDITEHGMHAYDSGH
jgi:Amt family ammonium transporter